MQENEREKIRHLLVLQDLDGQRTVPLLEATYSLGRDERNAIVLHSRSVSRQHAILLRVTIPDTDQYGFRIIDGNFKGKRSTNGLYINSTKCFAHSLQHGDTIFFGNHHAQAKYYAVSNLSEASFFDLCTAKNLSKFLLEQSNSNNPSDTLIVHSDSLEGASETALTRLASFPELIPNAIIEMDLEGTVTYLNPAAASKFPKIRKAGKNHPLLAGLPKTVQNRESNSFIREFVREIEVDGAIFEQSVHYLLESDLIRTFIVREITEQKLAEAELKKRDRLLKAVAEATNYLLAEMHYETAINKALAVLGEAAEVDRVYLFENYRDLATREMGVNVKFQWIRSTQENGHAHDQTQFDPTSRLTRWHDILSTGKSINGLTQEFTESEQALLNQYGIQSLLIVPLKLETEFWGYLGLADCTKERHWSLHEESTLSTMAASISGARQRQQVEEKIRYQALHDLLTGLPNRRLFHQRLSQALSQTDTTSQSENLAVIFLDLDRFKVINDILGHTLGDQLLHNVGQRLQNSLRSCDTLARWGGDEFIILLPQITSREEVAEVAKKILQHLEKAFHLQGHELFVSASLGIAMLNKNSPDAETLIQHADTALYCAKEKGRNNYQFYIPTHFNSQESSRLEKELRYAIEREELTVYYQPQINIITGKISGMEALLRWRHPEMGMVSPNVFIPIAEKNGLIIPIGAWVLRTACIQNKNWQKAGFPPLTMAVNLSLKQFRQPDLVEKVTEILTETELEPRFLELEITETNAKDIDIEFAKTLLKKMEDMGIRLSIDDFGIEGNTLTRLHDLPCHSLKIDSSFIRKLTTDDKAADDKAVTIVKSIVELGQQLGLRLTAEGVEKPEELEFLKSIRCDDVQGYLFYPPLSAEQATEIIKLRM